MNEAQKKYITSEENLPVFFGMVMFVGITLSGLIGYLIGGKMGMVGGVFTWVMGIAPLGALLISFVCEIKEVWSRR